MVLFAVISAVGYAMTVRSEGATVFINEFPVFELKTGQDGLTNVQRATNIAKTLSEKGLNAPLKTTTTARGTWIESGDVPVVKITAAEAKAQGVSVSELAATWKSRVIQAVNLPELQIPVGFLSVAEGETKFQRVFGSEAQDAEVSSDNPEIVTTEKVIGGFKFTAVSGGETTITVKSENSNLTLKIKVLPSAARINQKIEVTVYGNPASVESVRSAVISAVRNELQMAKGATLEIIGMEVAPVGSGVTLQVPVKVRVRAPGTSTFEGQVDVWVKNPRAQRLEEKELWYSNYPESVRIFGPIFGANLEEGKPVRLLFHHINTSPDPMVLQVVAYNPSPVAASVMVVKSSAKPDEDPVRAGLSAGEQFIKAIMYSPGDVITIPPRTKVLLSALRLAPNQVGSGLAYLSLLPNGPSQLLVRTETVRPINQEPTWNEANDAVKPWLVAAPTTVFRSPTDHPISEHIYVKPYRDLEAAYDVGGKYAFIRIGQSPIPSVDNRTTLEGNFGVMYTVMAKIRNLTNMASQVEIAYEASAGYSGALFVIDGELQTKPVLQSKEELQVKVLRLAPGESRQIKIQTMPLSGSSYPATLVVRPLGAK